MTKKQAFELCKKGAIIKYDDIFYLRWRANEFQTSIDQEHWAPGFHVFEPPTEYSLYKLVRVP